ncbi:MAG: class I adenylate cyclase [Cellvibrio sp.]|uniref:class I adenylate cyclase n=1 Tax=Cellvibrio sp. TaxID=1965322 RepID=UPI002729009F|nr:class I adenylate cyclase [Cellvibrio sp.]
MYSRPIDIHDIDEGVDRKQLNQLRQRFLDLNQLRHQRTCAALPERQQQFLQLLPLLFHVNHPMLPGYISHSTPAGVYRYTPNSDELRLAKILARSFQYNRDLTEKNASIDALFIMGSIGTIAQSDSSDLDVWVCHSLSANHEYFSELDRKCHLISQWAAQQINLEVHFFLMRSDEFSVQRIQSLSSEASGSAQHYLLLDEFYRTALWLAGKIPLWWFIPASQEHNYANYRDQLLGKRFVNRDDVIDFGGLPYIPANEFIGAGIWQLYKAIESPYKSVLKLLLLEVYASSEVDERADFGTAGAAVINDDSTPQIGLYQSSNNEAPGDQEANQQNPTGPSISKDAINGEPLALSFKRAIYAQDPDANALDPYVMVYRRIEQYLQKHNQLQRLDLVRRCFYFKVNKPLSRTNRQPNKTWQRKLLEELVKSWHWSAHQLHMLDNRAYWKAPHVITERALLVNELNHSYRLLSELSKHQQSDIAISSDELIILGRKLHAAFERKAGKIEWINPGISRDLSEDNLCFIREHNDNGESWQVVRGSQNDLALRNIDVEPIKRSRSLLELLLWCHANEILASHTNTDVIGKQFLLSVSQKQQLIQALQQWLPVPLTIEHQYFTRPATIEKLLIIVNTGVEPQADLHKKGMQMLSSQRDALGYSGLRENLMINADVIQINSWGELICRHYASDALINCLLHYFRLFPPGKQFGLPELSVRCFSSGQGNNIAQRLTELWRDLISCFYSGTRPRSCRYILEMGDEYLLLQFVQQQLQIQRFKSYAKLLDKLAQAQTDFSPIVIDRYGLRDKPLRIICEQVKQRGVYVFYQLEHTRAQITIVDERGSVFTTNTEYHNQQTLLRPLVNFINAAMQRQLLDGDNTGTLPDTKDVTIFELTGNIKQQQGHAERRQLHSDLSQLHFINIKAIAEIDDEQQLRFTIYCNEQEFSALAYGDDLFGAVASYIIRRRQHGERYPCYITDLDLSLCHDTIAQQTDVQLGHYLQLKSELENKLNSALNAL